MTELAKTSLSRREILLAGALALAGIAVAPRGLLADAAAVEKAIQEKVGDTALEEGRITLDLPQIAENGNTVPISLEVDSPMTADDYVKSVHIFAEGNPQPSVATFHFTPACGKAACSTRIRLAKTQNIVAVAEMSDGKVYTAKSEVKVTIGGCGG